MKAQEEGSAARLLIADDHALAREGLRTMLASEPDMEVIGEAEDGLEALELCRRLRPDLVLMDVRMPKMDGLAATRAIKAECPATSIIVVTSSEDPDHLLEAIKAGAAGYVLKDATKGELRDAARKALGGESPLDGGLAMQLLKRLAEEETQPPASQRGAPQQSLGEPEERRQRALLLPEPLTPRELEVLRHLTLGKTNRQIAQDLLLSVSTVKAHVQRLIAKLGVSDRTQAAVLAVKLGLIAELEDER